MEGTDNGTDDPQAETEGSTAEASSPEVASLVLAEPGSYTVNGDRGTSWSFAVSDDGVCTDTGGTYSDVWPPGT